ncbi:hypothetical protein CRI94_01650 [Longibacter salinarum]|uniref:Glycosyltransferase 2-like domain-containing protein n=1 Tax=Longibacter salinarum TaxID=1850348 RepID=A0A2A8D2Z6_9BACT|nr:glycosyltransferase [Longibacter salinarum]PEN15018.1 hypothetical protein CRI94_01650 [Longibacter salinarum]
MPDALFLVLSITVGLHVLTVGAATVGWFRVLRDSNQVTQSGEWPSVSVLIPARNEATLIGDCLSSVLENDYPGELEIIVIDDNSEDATLREARRAFASTEKALTHETAVTNVGGMSGEYTAPIADDEAEVVTRVIEARDGTETERRIRNKTAALTAGIESSTGDVILTTDADCVVGSRWIRTMVRRCTLESPMISGPVRFDWREKWFDRVQAIEMTALVAFGAGTLGAGFPTICNGANVAMRRSLLSEYGSATVAADEVLLQHVAYDTDQEVIFEAHPDAVVETGCVDDVAEYIEQRSRWAWMGTRYPYAIPSLVAVSQWFIHAALLVALIAAIAIPTWQPVVIGALLVKMAADGLLVAPAARHLGQNELTRTFIPASLLWIPSAVIIGLLGTFGTVHWKGRRVE